MKSGNVRIHPRPETFVCRTPLSLWLGWSASRANVYLVHYPTIPSWTAFGQPLFLAYGGRFVEGLLGRFRRTSILHSRDEDRWLDLCLQTRSGGVTCETRRVEHRPNGPQQRDLGNL